MAFTDIFSTKICKGCFDIADSRVVFRTCVTVWDDLPLLFVLKYFDDLYFQCQQNFGFLTCVLNLVHLFMEKNTVEEISDDWFG